MASASLGIALVQTLALFNERVRGRRPYRELLVIRGNQAVATPRDFAWTEVPSSCNRVTGSSQSSPRCSDPSGCPQPPLGSHRYDAGRDGFIDLMELKLMMEKLGAPQTHLGLKNMIKEVDEDFDSKLSFREVSPLPVVPRARREGQPCPHGVDTYCVTSVHLTLGGFGNPGEGPVLLGSWNTEGEMPREGKGRVL